jgi:adenylate cyclase
LAESSSSPATASSAIVIGENIITAAVYERPAGERPDHATIPEITQWLTTAARAEASFLRMIDELAWRLLAAGLPLLRFSLHSGTLHPQFRSLAYIWWRDTAQTHRIMITYEVADFLPYAINPVRRVREGRETLRRPLDGPDDQFDFSILADLKARGATEYFAFPIPSGFGFGAHMLACVSDRAGGFTNSDIAHLTSLSEPLSVLADMNSQKHIAENVLRAYLGPQTGPRVLAGEIRRGSGELIDAIIWSSDLRGFTALSDHAPADEVIAILNELFDLQARTIARYGGEILKFIGDGLLAIFPVEHADQAAQAAADALRAAQETLDGVRARNTREPDAPLRMVIALHYGSVTYGNIGSAERLDFTVIGPAVNLVSRAEALAKSLELPLVVTDDFASVYRGELQSLGWHQLRGLDKRHELFAPVEQTAEAG